MAPRNTDADWQAISRKEPYFGVLTDPRFLKENLTDAAVDDFYRSGGGDVEWAIGNIRTRFDPTFRAAHAIDFGCGVGRQSFALSNYADRVTGVDVSPAMLAAAERVRIERHLATVAFRDGLPDEPAQWIYSCLVFQHIPPARGYDLLRDLLARLVPGGIASIQLTTHREPHHLAGALDDIGLCRFDGERLEVIAAAKEMPVGEMRMYDYDLGRVLPIFVAAGIGAVWLFHANYSGHHGCWILGRKE